MKTKPFSAFESKELRASASRDESGLILALDGSADVRVISDLESLLKRVHDEALGVLVKDVTVDFRGLEFMNSSCFKCFVSWLGWLEDLGAEKHYTITFLSDPKKLWQRRSLGALACLAADIVRVKT
jgi:hypothetical protein